MSCKGYGCAFKLSFQHQEFKLKKLNGKCSMVFFYFFAIEDIFTLSIF